MSAVMIGCMPGGWGNLLLVLVGLFVVFGGIAVLDFGAAVLLRLACRLADVPQPDIDQAMFVSFVEIMLGGLILLGHFAMFDLPSSALPTTAAWHAPTLGLSAVVVMLVVAAGIYVPALKIGFPKGLQVSAARYCLSLSALAVLRFLFVFASYGT